MFLSIKLPPRFCGSALICTVPLKGLTDLFVQTAPAPLVVQFDKFLDSKSSKSAFCGIICLVTVALSTSHTSLMPPAMQTNLIEMLFLSSALSLKLNPKNLYDAAPENSSEPLACVVSRLTQPLP